MRTIDLLMEICMRAPNDIHKQTNTHTRARARAKVDTYANVTKELVQRELR